MLAQATSFNPLEPDRQLSKKNAKHEVLQFSRIWCNGPVGTAVTARVSRGECDGGLSFTTIFTAHVRRQRKQLIGVACHGPLQLDVSPVYQATNPCVILFC